MEMNQLLNIEFDMDDVQVNTSTVFSYNMESIDGGDKAIANLFAEALIDILENGGSSLPDMFIEDAEFLINTWLEDGLKYCKFKYADNLSQGLQITCKCNTLTVNINISQDNDPLHFIDEVLEKSNGAPLWLSKPSTTPSYY